MNNYFNNDDAFYCESKKDPNVIIAELDIGLHSGRIGEQCGAIVRYPQLFDSYPYPNIIMSSFIKLANIFRTGTNSLRLCVFQVTQQCSKHLEKIGNFDNIVRCIHSVMYNNDPVARALTLKMLGSMACIISEQKFVHHSILSSLESQDQVEILAAIFAATEFAGKSKSFSESICTKLPEMIEKSTVSNDIKFKFLLICRDMNCDFATLVNVRDLCLSVLDKYHSCRFVVSVLHTMTLLSKKSLVHIGQQIELLLKYLHEDVRVTVKKSSLKDLQLLACCSPHVWKNCHVHSVLEYFKRDRDPELFLLILEVLSTLSSTIAVYLLAENIDSTNSPMANCCHMACLHNNPQISMRGIKIFMNLASYEISLLNVNFLKEDEEKPPVIEDLCGLIEMRMNMSVNGGSSGDLLVFKECLASTLKLCKVCPSLISQLAQHTVYLLSEYSKDINKSIALCELLSAFHCEFDEVPMIETSLKSVLHKSMNSFQSIGESEETLILAIIRLLLQTRDKTSMRYNNDQMKEIKENEDEVDTLIIKCLDKVSPWTSFRMARQASRFGSHKVASAIFSTLTNLNIGEYNGFWLEALTNYCAGEALLCSNSKSHHVENVLKAIEFLQTAFDAFKSTSISENSFQIDYVNMRLKTLRCFMQITHACTSYQLIPPPAIASTITKSTNLCRYKVPHLIDQLKSCKNMLSDLERGYECLYYKCFDADSHSLHHISLLLDMCKLLSITLDSFFDMTEFNPSSVAEELFEQKIGETREWKHWLIIKDQIMKFVKDMNGLKYKAVRFIEEVVTLCSKFPICLPRFFFQKLQSTDIKLIVSPVMKSGEDPIFVECGSDAIVKVKGILSKTGKKSSNQNASKIHLDLRSELITNQSISNTISNRLFETCSLQGDYFCHKFNLSFTTPGIHQVCIDVGILDDSGNLWNTGVKSLLLFSSFKLI